MLCTVYTFMKIISILCELIIVVNCIDHDVVETVFEWKGLQFDYPSAQARQEDIDNGIYNPDVPIPFDVEAFYDRHNIRFVFVTIPKLRPGVPITVGYITDKKIDGDPVIAPFPSWEWHRNTSECTNKFVSVYQLTVDSCGNLYVLDTGNEGNGIICPPKMVMFNLNHFPGSRYVRYYYTFPTRVYKSNSVFVDFAIQTIGILCNIEVYAFVADASRSNLVYAVVHNPKSSSTRTITHPSMKPNNAFSHFEILGDKFVLRIGIFIIKLLRDSHPMGVFHTLEYMAMSSGYWNYVDVVSMHRGTSLKFATFPTPLKSPVGALVTTRRGVMFFGNMFNTSILCSNIGTSDVANTSYTIYKNATTMQFPSSMTVVNDRAGREELWIMTNRLQKALTTGYNFKEINFRISVASIQTLIKHSPCLKPNI